MIQIVVYQLVLKSIVIIFLNKLKREQLWHKLQINIDYRLRIINNIINLMMNFLNLLAMGMNNLGFNLTGHGCSLPSLFSQQQLSGPIHSQIKTPTNEPEPERPAVLPPPQSILADQTAPSEQSNKILELMVCNLREEIIVQQNNLLTQCLTLMQTSNEPKSENKIEEPAVEEQPQHDSVARKKMYEGNQCRSKVVVVCGHESREHYAKGLCSSCYRRIGRTKKPWKCSHEKLYAAGLCQNCYTNQYNKKKRTKVLTERKEDLIEQQHKEVSKFEAQEKS